MKIWQRWRGAGVAALWIMGALAVSAAWLPPAPGAAAQTSAASVTPDPSFGMDGTATLDLRALGYQEAGATALAVQPDGRVVAAGLAVAATYVEGLGDVMLARLLPDGAPDASLGTGGVALIHVEERVSGAVAVALQPDGKIVTAGTVAATGPIDGDGSARIIELSMDVVLTRSLSDGSPDPTFGVDGRVVADYGGQDIVVDLAILPDGAIVVLGRAWVFGRLNREVLVARFLTDGAPDPGFGVGGSILVDFGRAEHPARALAVQPDGKLVILGAGVRPDASTQHDLALARLLPDGTLDPTFGAGGIVLTDFERLYDRPGGLVLQSDGKIVVAGGARRMKPNGSDAEIVVVRYNADGSMDPTFGDAGVGIVDLGTDDWAFGLVQTPNGRLIVTSRLSQVGVLIGFTADGKPDPTFGQGGVLRAEQDLYGRVTVQPDGKLLLSVAKEGRPVGIFVQRLLVD